jgi:hypothetical protein
MIASKGLMDWRAEMLWVKSGSKYLFKTRWFSMFTPLEIMPRWNF